MTMRFQDTRQPLLAQGTRLCKITAAAAAMDTSIVFFAADRTVTTGTAATRLVTVPAVEIFGDKTKMQECG